MLEKLEKLVMMLFQILQEVQLAAIVMLYEIVFLYKNDKNKL